MRAYNNPKYFDRDGYCNDHREDHCDACQDLSSAPTITAIAIRQDDSREAEDVKTNFGKQVEFIQAALDMDDEKLDKVKVKDMVALTRKGQDEITVGKMKKWLKIDKKNNLGVVGSLFKQLKWSLADKEMGRDKALTIILLILIGTIIISLFLRTPH